MTVQHISSEKSILSASVSERHFLVARLPPPDPAGTTFIHDTESESESPVDLFNTRKNVTVRDVCISGMTLVFDAEEDLNQLCKRYSLSSPAVAPDIQSMEWIADTIIIRSPLYIPGGNLTIYARELIFKDKGCIHTTPIAEKTLKDTYETADTGENGGNITVFASKIDTGTGNVVRFVLDGAKGRGPKIGEKGKDGPCVSKLWNGDIFTLIPIGQYTFARSVTTWDETKFDVKAEGRVQVFLYVKGCWNSKKYDLAAEYCNDVQGYSPPFRKYKRGVPKYPADGHPSTRAAGQPGRGGDAGEFSANIPVTKGSVSQAGGEAGTPAAPTPGGDAGTPTQTVVETYQYVENTIFERALRPATCKKGKVVRSAVHQTEKGPDKESPVNIGGGDKVVPPPTGKVSAWVHPVLLQVVLSYVKLVYLSGNLETVDKMLATYAMAGEPDNPDWQSAVASLTLQMDRLRKRYDDNLDYFGNEAGWEPELALPIVINIFKDAVCDALETWFLASWLNNRTNLVEEDAGSVQQAMKILRGNVDDQIHAINESQNALVKLGGILNELESQHQEIQKQIEKLQGELTEDVKIGDAAKKIAFFALNTAATVCSVIPWGQPFLGTIASAGAELLTKLDPDHPPKSSKEIFDLFSSFVGTVKDTEPSDEIKEAQAAIKDIAKFVPDVLKPENRKNTEETLSKAAGKLSELGNKLSPFFSNFAEQLTQLKAPESEIEERLRQAEEQCPEYQELLTKVRALNDQKKALVGAVDNLEDLLNSSLGELTANLDTSVSLCKKLDQKLGKLDHTTFRYVQSLAQKEKEVLNRYQYYLVMSYLANVMPEAVANEGNSGFILKLANYQLEDMMKKIIVLLEDKEGKAGKVGLLEIDRKNPDSNPLYHLFTGVVGEITGNLVAGFINNPISQDQTEYTSLILDVIPFNDPDETKRSIVINLMDMIKLPLNRERIRIVDFGVEELVVDPQTDASEGQIEIAFLHSGDGTIRCSGGLYAVRHPLRPGHPEDSKTYWTTTFDIFTGHLSPGKPLTSDKVFLEQFVTESLDDIDDLIQYRPPAWGNIAISRTDTGVDRPAKLQSLVVKYKLSSALTSATELGDKALHILPRGTYPQVITCDKEDLNEQTDGWGSLFRMYRPDTEVTIEAPARFGEWAFQHWEDEYGGNQIKNRKYTVTMSGDLTRYYVYSSTAPE